MTWNLLHLVDAQGRGGIWVLGNQRTEWTPGCRSDFPNPQHG